MQLFSLNLGGSSSGGGGNAFTIIQPDTGTAPTALSSTSTLTLTSTDLGVAGNSGTNTITFSLNTVGIAKGGTGQTTKTPSFDALQPMSASGDIIYGGTAGTGTRLAKGADGTILNLASGIPAWTATPTLTSLTITSTGALKSNGYHLEVLEYSAGNTSTALTLDWNNGSSQTCTATGNVTFTLSNPVTGGVYVIRIVQDGTGGRTYTWPAAVKWPGGTAPTGSAASKIDLINLYYDGTNYYGSSSLNY